MFKTESYMNLYFLTFPMGGGPSIHPTDCHYSATLNSFGCMIFNCKVMHLWDIRHFGALQLGIDIWEQTIGC